MKHVALLLAVLMVAGSAQAVTTVLREGGEYNEDGAIDVSFDVLSITDDGVDGLANAPDYYSAMASDPAFYVIGVKDMMSYLPADPNDIVSVTLTLVQMWGDNDYLDCYRITTPWMTDAAGASEFNTNWYYADIANTTTWSAGDFSTADYTTADGAHADFDESVYADPYDYDVTAQVLAMYTDGNNGWVAFSEPDLSVNTYSEDTDIHKRPYVTIEYVPEPATIGLLAIGGIGALIRRKR